MKIYLYKLFVKYINRIFSKIIEVAQVLSAIGNRGMFCTMELGANDSADPSDRGQALNEKYQKG